METTALNRWITDGEFIRTAGILVDESLGAEVAQGKPVSAPTRSRAETPVLIRAYVALAQALRWKRLLLLAVDLKLRELPKSDDDNTWLVAEPSAGKVVCMVAELIRRTARQQVFAPKLRAWEGATAVEVFLGQGALLPIV